MKSKTVNIKIKNETVTKAEHYIRMVGLGTVNSCILIGPPGMGKTHLVTRTLEDMDIDYELYGGHITLAETYEYLFENSDKLIFFDDVSQVINKVEIMEMLKQALNTSGSRTLHYRSKNVLNGGTPKSFEFTGKIIFAFNIMDVHNANVKAIMDRSLFVELRYSRADTIKALYQIAGGDSGVLMEHEKMIVTKEIEDWTDSTMDVSLRKQNLAFKIYSAAKTLYGEGNETWIDQVRGLFGKKKRSWVEDIIIDLVGEKGRIKRSELVKEIATRRDMSPRTVHRRLTEFVSVEILFENKIRGGDISMIPFK